MKYLYPAIFTPSEDGYDVYVPDLPGCRTCGESLIEAMEMAEDAVSLWLWDTEEENGAIPSASTSLQHEAPQFVSFIKADTDLYKRQMDSRAVKKTLSIPAWLNHQAEAAHINFSSVLQEALKTQLHIQG
jgi:predicted RNase H-like HicB family nuclease